MGNAGFQGHSVTLSAGTHAIYLFPKSQYRALHSQNRQCLSPGGAQLPEYNFELLYTRILGRYFMYET